MIGEIIGWLVVSLLVFISLLFLFDILKLKKLRRKYKPEDDESRKGRERKFPEGGRFKSSLHGRDDKNFEGISGRDKTNKRTTKARKLIDKWKGIG